MVDVTAKLSLRMHNTGRTCDMLSESESTRAIMRS